MMPQPVAQRRCLVISTDFVTGLPNTNWGSDTILIIVHGFFKRCHPCTKELTELPGKMYPSTEQITTHLLGQSAPKNGIKDYHKSNWSTIQREVPCEIDLAYSPNPSLLDTPGELKRRKFDNSKG